MIHGMDTSFLVVLEMREHTDHWPARNALTRWLIAGDRLAIAPEVLSEFIHVVTDSRRFTQSLSMPEACRLAEQWWTSKDVVQVFPNDAALRQFFAWLKQFSLGRKRLLDTLLAATYHQAGITSILTTNPADFMLFGNFTCITPTALGSSP
jgi:predicted nucleic acid-binding protein